MSNGAFIALELSRGKHNIKREGGAVYVRSITRSGAVLWVLAGRIQGA
jgi:hypothetical protein